MRRLLVPLGLVLLLAGCSAPSIPPLPEPDGSRGPVTEPTAPPTAPPTAEPVTVVDQYRGLPPGVEFADSLPAGWAPDVTGRIAIVTYGSGSCPSEPVSFDRDSTAVLSLWVEYTGDAEVCSADMTPTTSIIELPDGFSSVVTVLVNGEPAPRLA